MALLVMTYFHLCRLEGAFKIFIINSLVKQAIPEMTTSGAPTTRENIMPLKIYRMSLVIRKKKTSVLGALAVEKLPFHSNIRPTTRTILLAPTILNQKV
jgi:hypothetical protein